jgi:hypothetical protein
MTADTISSIDHGIVFLMARWSGSATWAHRQLTQSLRQRGIPPERLTCVDIDREAAVYDVAEFSGKIHGWGEAAVVKHGRITFFTVLGRDQARIGEQCEQLLTAYEA